MKTNLKKGVFAFALLASVSGVFASNIKTMVTGKKLAAYTWTKYDESGNPTGTNIPGDENSFSECPTTPTQDLCAHGELVSDPSVTIDRYYQ
ncbi:hypothetical protein [Pedobacter sp.]|uniref:hypothetical protein n=1 Tax=Pedobacter sp. TaxID=1411316 RepID=UPI003BAD682A